MMELFPPAYHLHFDRHHPVHQPHPGTPYQHPLFVHHPPPPPPQSNTPADDQPIDDEPLYVNAKQYFRILKRRVARARLEEVHRLSRQRKPYLHESRHKHAMRRPRGPGGRFLTAEEIAAQKSSASDHRSPSNPVDVDLEDEMDDDDPIDIPSPLAPVERDPYMNHTPDPMAVMYRLQPHQIPLAQPQQPPPQQPQPPPKPHSPSHNIYAQHSKGLTGGAPITLSSPYPAVQMHHVPHPHAHARHHHSNLNYTHGLYNASDTANANAEIQRRTEEMIQFSAAGSS
ncbi:CCAAT-binding transcription factor (CBF-B/NF-YA) subunit B-domain-containing protein [Collybia nuda]|uniref:Transcriptional activator HAP2 n=1 Tax=Collybia nuda TaxID=64659 RepID=A0A9P5XZC3_9AGAR|nr:CCAAT-binding transcription factor (CBF-B/NF-YA) subunit B-domain-containing protein [Collybia nuda]